MHFGSVELVEQHGSTRRTQLARHARLDELDTSNVHFGCVELVGQHGSTRDTTNSIGSTR